MMTLAAIPLTCWLCTLLATPRRPLPGNEIQELVYARLLGRQQRLLLLALIASLIAFSTFTLHLPSIGRAEVATTQGVSPVVCDDPETMRINCGVPGQGGVWQGMHPH